MKIAKILIVAAMAGLLSLVGCRSNPVLNIENTAITVPDKFKLEDVKKAIITAGGSLGWVMKEKEPGQIIGTLIIREHTAVVLITYDKSKYSIKYKDSVNLNYDGTNIHSNYNGWIQNLNQHIQVQINIM